MRIRLCLFLLWAVSSLTLPSEAQNPNEFKILKGKIPIEVIPDTAQWRFPEVRKGTIFLYNENALPALLNYNFLYNEMQFIGQEGDTLSPAADARIKEVTIGNIIS